MESEYPKLVRDKIPEIIEAHTGQEPEMRIAHDEKDFEEHLLKKIVEEALELQRSGEEGNLEEEVADISELIDTLLALKDKKKEEIEEIKRAKREKNGGFDRRIIMLSKVEKPKE